MPERSSSAIFRGAAWDLGRWRSANELPLHGVQELSYAIDRSFVIHTLENLVRIDSVNPSLDPQGAGEAEVGAYVAGVCRDLGLEAHTHEPAPGRVSAVGILRGSGGGRSLMLNAHYDTVSLEGDRGLLEPKIENGRLLGRGAYDMKGSLAACLGAVKALREAGTVLAGDLLVAGVADEEVSSLGTADLIERYPVDGAIVTEPSQLNLCRAHKGFVWLEVTVFGRVAHGSQWQQGIDANRLMGRVLVKLDELDQRLRREKNHPLLGPPSLHAATLQGGTGLTTYAERCVLNIERRTLPGETEEQVVAEVEEILELLGDADPSFRANCRTLFSRPAFEVSADAEIVRVVEEASATVLGKRPKHVGENPWMDSALLAQAGVETVVIGPKGGGAHAPEEWVDLDSVVDLARILAVTAERYCQRYSGPGD